MLADAYDAQGKAAAAERARLRAIAMLEQVYGTEHILTATIRSSLVNPKLSRTLGEQGDETR